MTRKQNIAPIFAVAAAVVVGGCQSTSPLGQRVTQIRRQLHLIPTPISSHGMSGTIGRNGTSPIGIPVWAPFDRRPYQRGPINSLIVGLHTGLAIGSPDAMMPPFFHNLPPSAQSHFAKAMQPVSAIPPEVAAAFRTVKANSQVIKQLGKTMKFQGKYKFQSESFRNGTTNTEFEYGLQGEQGKHTTMSSRTMVENGKTTRQSLSVRPDSGQTIVLK